MFRWEENDLQPDDGDFVTLDGEEGFQRVLDAPPARTGDGPLDVYRLGANGDLVGQRVEDLPLGDPVEEEGHVNRRRELASVDLDADELPAFASGETVLRGPDPVYAVAVNGVVAGWAHGYLLRLLPPGLDPRYLEQPHVRWWWTMVPPSLFRSGRNRVELLRIDGEGAARVLHPVRLRPEGAAR